MQQQQQQQRSSMALSPAPSTTRASSVASHGSQTTVTTAAAVPTVPTGILHLRGAPVRSVPRVQWADDTVDNENMGRKRSKVCCIYHRPRRFDESDGESSCDSDCDSDGPNDYERAPRSKQHSSK